MIFSFSLSGNKPRYTDGVKLNYDALQRFLPNQHQVFLHIDDTAKVQIPNEWNVVRHNRNQSNECMFWRFETIDANIIGSNEVVHVRDIDSVVTLREIDLLESLAKKAYCIRDHQWHADMPYPVLGGLWGASPSALFPHFSELVRWWIEKKAPFEYLSDMWFLNRYVYPHIVTRGIEIESLASRRWGTLIDQAKDADYMGRVATQ